MSKRIADNQTPEIWEPAYVKPSRHEPKRMDGGRIPNLSESEGDLEQLDDNDSYLDGEGYNE